jgi:hypothetical protein
MSKIKLEDAVTTKKTLDVQVRPALYASKCDSCGKVFHMKPFCNDRELGVVNGTFEESPTDRDGRGIGNGFIASVCSFACAHEIFANGGWKKMTDYAVFAKADIRLARAHLTLTPYLQTEEEVRLAWSAVDEVSRMSIPIIRSPDWTTSRVGD